MIDIIELMIIVMIAEIAIGCSLIIMILKKMASIEKDVDIYRNEKRRRK